MAWNPKLKLTPRLVAMLEYEERRATERGDGYLGTEHMLEAILSDPQDNRWCVCEADQGERWQAHITGVGRRATLRKGEPRAARGRTMHIRFTGAGWLGLVLPVLAFVAGGIAVTGLGLDLSPAAGGVFIVALLVGGAVQWLVGRGLNSVRTAEGRIWHDRHTLQDAPLQRAAGFYVVAAFVIGCVVLGAATSPIIGVAVFVAASGLGLTAFIHRLRQLGVDWADMARTLAVVLLLPALLVTAGLAERISAVVAWGLFAAVAGTVYLVLFHHADRATPGREDTSTPDWP
jgi:hypothetical protein